MIDLSFSPLREVESIDVIRAVVVEGKGVEGDPKRRVVYFFSADGHLLARRDEWIEEQKPPKHYTPEEIAVERLAWHSEYPEEHSDSDCGPCSYVADLMVFMEGR